MDWRLVLGCTPCSLGCERCYAARRLADLPQYNRLTTMVDGCKRFTGEVRIFSVALGDPLAVEKPQLWQICPEGDLLHKDVPRRLITDALAVMRIADWHEFYLSTRRPGRLTEISQDVDLPHNLWCGFSASDQDEFNQMWAAYRRADINGHRFALLEPLLGPIVLPDDASGGEFGLDFVTVMSEAYEGGRGMKIKWLRALREQCESMGIQFFWERSSWDRVNAPWLENEYENAKSSGHPYIAAQHAVWGRELPRHAMKAAGVWPPAQGGARRQRMPTGGCRQVVTPEMWAQTPAGMTPSAWREALENIGKLCIDAALIAKNANVASDVSRRG